MKSLDADHRNTVLAVLCLPYLAACIHVMQCRARCVSSNKALYDAEVRNKFLRTCTVTFSFLKHNNTKGDYAFSLHRQQHPPICSVWYWYSRTCLRVEAIGSLAELCLPRGVLTHHLDPWSLEKFISPCSLSR